MKSLIKSLLICCAATTLVTLVACDNDDENSIEAKPSITFITDHIATDDQGYNSLLYQVMREWDKRTDIEVDILIPRSKRMAKEMFEKWPEQTQNKDKALLVVAAQNYRDMIEESNIKLQDHQRVLAFEGKALHQPKGFSSFTFNRNGAAYLAGKMASKCKDIVVVAGEGQPHLNTAWKAFQQGLEGQHIFDVIYLAFGNEGFNNPDSAYHAAAEHPDAFVLPLAGKSNLGIYQFLNEAKWPQQINAAGMDVDCNARSPRIPFSIILHVDQVMNQYIRTWLEGKEMPQYQSWGMESGMVEIRFNDNYTNSLDVKLADFKNFYNKYKAEALEKESSFAPGVN